MEWLVNPLPLILLGLVAVIALLASLLRGWQPLTIAIYVVGSVLMIFAILWAIALGEGAYGIAASAGIGTWLAQHAINRAKVEPRAPRGRRRDAG